MAENTINKNVRNDEIDISDLFRRMGKTLKIWARALGRAFLITIVFLFRRWLPLGLSLIAGVGFSYLAKTTTASFYTSDMTLRTNVIPTVELITYINRLQRYNAKDLSEALSLKRESFGNVNNISAFWIIDQRKDGIPDYIDFKNDYNVYDTTHIRMTDRLAVRVIIKSPQELSLVRDGILSFIERNSLFQQLNQVRLQQNKEMLTRLDYDILQLDSLQKVKYFEETRNRNSKSGGQIVFIQEQSTPLLYNDIYSLISRKQALEFENDLYKDLVTVLNDFSTPTIRDNGISYYGKQIIPLFFFVTLLILILVANRKKILEVYKKY